MNIHEYQAKELLAGFGVPVPKGGVAYTPDGAVYVATGLGGSHWAVKAQIHAGGRGKAGGVRFCRTYHEVAEAAGSLLGKTLATSQTGAAGQIVHRLYVENVEPFIRELYLGLVLDRKIERIRVIASDNGGADIEDIATLSPGSLREIQVEPAVGLQPFQARELAFGLGLNLKLVSKAVSTILGCYRAFRELDAKMSFDDNALFRRPQVAEMRDITEEDPREAEAAGFGLNFVALTVNIGCIINGAGLAMATMDMIKHAGGEPANFLDVGGGASPERIAEAFRLVLLDMNVKAVLVNIFAGINRCDWVAQGVVAAAKDLKLWDGRPHPKRHQRAEVEMLVTT